jgi:hypothetical protein
MEYLKSKTPAGDRLPLGALLPAGVRRVIPVEWIGRPRKPPALLLILGEPTRDAGITHQNTCLFLRVFVIPFNPPIKNLTRRIAHRLG